MERKRHLPLICFLAALVLALVASTAVYWTRSARQARALESVSQRSLSQLLSSLSSMETLLEKTRYAGSGPLRSLLAAQLWNESQLAAAAFGALHPIGAPAQGPGGYRPGRLPGSGRSFRSGGRGESGAAGGPGGFPGISLSHL